MTGRNRTGGSTSTYRDTMIESENTNDSDILDLANNGEYFSGSETTYTRFPKVWVWGRASETPEVILDKIEPKADNKINNYNSYYDYFEVPEPEELVQKDFIPPEITIITDGLSQQILEVEIDKLEIQEPTAEKLVDTDKSLLESTEKEANLKVLLITEGTYPFHWGGVSTWCHLLIRDLPEVDFTLFSIVANPQLEPQINLLSNVVSFLPVPLWGVREVLELRKDLTLAELRRRKKLTTDKIIALEFVPVFRNFLSEVFLSDNQPENLAVYVHKMYRFFLEYDFDTVFQ